MSRCCTPHCVQPFQQGFQQVVDNEADGTRVQDPTWGWNPEHLLNSGTEEVTGTGHLQMNKTDSWGQLEMLTKDVLDKLEGPDWEALGMVSDPGIQEIDTFLAADNPEAQELLPVPQNHHPSQQFHVGQDFKSDNTEVVPLPSTSEPNSAAASLDGSPLVKDATPTTIPGPFAHSDRSTFGAGLGGLPLAGIEYGGPSMWGMQSSANGNTSEGVGTSASALPGLSEISLLPADLGLSGPSTGSSMWDTAESLLDTHHRHARSHEQHNMWGGSVFGVPCVGQGSDMQQGLWIAQQPNQQHVRVQGRSARESRERKPQKPTGRYVKHGDVCA